MFAALDQLSVIFLWEKQLSLDECILSECGHACLSRCMMKYYGLLLNRNDLKHC